MLRVGDWLLDKNTSCWLNQGLWRLQLGALGGLGGWVEANMRLSNIVGA